MKGLQFFGNRVEDAANAFIDVLKQWVWIKLLKV